MEKKKVQLEYINLAYIIGTILVVFGHSYPLNIHDVGIPEFMKIIQKYIYVFHMPLFFFIAGFLFNYSNSISSIGYRSYIKNKAIKLMIPYFILSIIGILPKYIIGDISINIENVIRVLSYPREYIWGHFWFIPTLFIMYCIFGKVIKANESRYSTYIYIITSLIIYFISINSNLLAINDLCKYSIYFVLGTITSKLRYDFEGTNNLYLLIISLILFSIKGNYGAYFNKFIDILIAILMILFILKYSKSIINKVENINIFKQLKGKTYTIYLLSWIFQAPVEIILNRILHLPWYLVMICMFSTGIIMPLIIIKIFKILNIKNIFFKTIIGIEGAS